MRLIERLGPGEPLGEASMVRALEQMAEGQLRAELMAEHFRYEAKQWFAHLQHAQGELAHEREALGATRETLDDGRVELERDRDSAARAAAQAREQLELFKRTRRYRAAEALARPLDRLRGALGR